MSNTMNFADEYKNISDVLNYFEQPDGDELELAATKTAEFIAGIDHARSLVSGLLLDEPVEGDEFFPALVINLYRNDDYEGAQAFYWGFYEAAAQIIKLANQEGEKS